MRRWHRNVLVVKATVMVGLAAYYLVPPDLQFLVGLTTNILWLWRT